MVRHVRDRGYPRRVLAPAVVAWLLVVVPPALAQGTTTIYATPSGASSGMCPASTPCSLSQALAVASGDESGDDVTIQLAAGNYPGQETISSGTELSLTLLGSGAATLSASSGTTLTASAAVPLTIEDLTIEGGSPGVAVSDAAGVTIRDAALIDNTADGLDATNGSITIDDSTIAGNGGIGLHDEADSSQVALYGTTLVSNSSGGVEATGAGTLELGADVLYKNTAGDCVTSTGTIVDEGYNFADDGACALTASTSKKNDGALAVAALAQNGGPTETAALTSASDGYDAVPTSVTLTGQSQPFCSGTDQRGIARTQGPAGTCSAGAYQYAPPVITTVSPRASLELGLSLTLDGYGLANGTTASFGSTGATITSQSGTSLTLTVPTSLALGSEPITLTNPDGSAQVAFNAVASPSVATWIMPAGALRVPYTQSLPVAGGAGPYSYKLVSGALPAGLSLSSSGVISGTPTKAGGSAFGVQVTDANGFASPSLNVTLIIATPVVTLGSATHLTLKAGLLPVALSCAAAPCTGRVSLDESVTVKRKHQKATVEMVPLATVSYDVAAGQSTTVELALTPAGKRVLSKRALKKARKKKHPLQETLTAAAAGATTATATVSVS